MPHRSTLQRPQLLPEAGRRHPTRLLHHDTDNNTSASSASSRQSSKGNKQKKSNSKVFGKSHNSNGQVAPQQSGLMPFNWQQQPWAAWAPWLAQWPNPPPCPYPASSWALKNVVAPTVGPRQFGPGILGSRPQAYNAIAPSTSYTPTDIEAAMHALSFSQPDGNFYMDTGATSHMSAVTPSTPHIYVQIIKGTKRHKDVKGNIKQIEVMFAHLIKGCRPL